MARKGKEIALQQEIETQEEWEDMLSKEGLCVVDLYQGWCGLCSGMKGNFRKIQNEISDNLLRLYGAKCDTIDALEKYRGHCEPCFLFFAGGVMVAVVRGANAPLILRTITEQLAHEHKVLDGQAERKEIKDTMIAQLNERDRQAEEEEEEPEGGAKKRPTQAQASAQGKEPVKEVSVVIIKPDAVDSGKADEIIAEMKKRGIEILQQDERQLTEDEVKNIYTHLQDEEYFPDLVTYMTRSPCIVMAITKGKTGDNIIKEFRELIGPTEVEEAKEQAPESLRAKFGGEKYMNAVHGSDSSDTAARELAFFFPNFAAPKVEGKGKLQRTLALIRPDAYKEHKDEILAKIREAGFKVAMSKEVHLTKEQAEDFYSEHRGQEYFDELTDRMSNGALLALGLAREEAIAGWRDMLGPTKIEDAKEEKPDSLRAQFSVEGASINMLHGSDSEETAKKEIEYFFPMEQTIAVIKPDAHGTKDEIIDKIHEAGFRIAARKETTLSKEIAEEFYGDHKDKEYYNELVDHMSSGPTLFMVLSREGAVDGWRSLIGPTDPLQAKEVDPDTLRGKYGTDILRNAVHGSTDKEHALTTITKIFDEQEGNALKSQWPAESPLSSPATSKNSKVYTKSGDSINEQGPGDERAKSPEAKPAADKPAEEPQQQQQTEEKPSEEKAQEEEQQAQVEKPQEEEEQPPVQQEEQKPSEESQQQQESQPETQAEKTEAAPEPAKTEEEQKPAEEEKPAEDQKPAEEKAPEQQAETEAPKAEEEPAKQEEAPKDEPEPAKEAEQAQEGGEQKQENAEQKEEDKKETTEGGGE